MWTFFDVFVVCVPILIVFVLCCVCWYLRVRFNSKLIEPRNSAKMFDESGVDLAGSDSSSDPPAQGDSKNDFGEILKQFMQRQDEERKIQEQRWEENRKIHEERWDENRKIQEEHFRELKGSIQETKEELNETIVSRIAENAREMEEKFSKRFSEHEAKCDERFDQLQKCFDSQAEKVGQLENQLGHEIKTLKCEVGERCVNIESQVVKVTEELGHSRAETKVNFDKLETEMHRKLRGFENKIEGLDDSLEKNVTDVKKELRENINRIDKKLCLEVSQIQEKVNLIGNAQEEDSRGNQSKFREEIDRNVKILVREALERDRENNVGNCPTAEAGLRFSWAPPQNLCFSGSPDENPKVFLDRAENYMALTKSVPSSLKPRFMQELLRGNAAHWLTALTPFPSSYEEFRHRFLARFWGEQTRYEFERKILESRWDKRSNLSYLDYAMGKISAIKLCDPQAGDKKIIWLLTAHFPFYVQNLINSVGCENLDRFQELLAQFDRTRTNFPDDESERNPRSYQNGGQRNQQPWQRDGRRPGADNIERRPPSAPPGSRPENLTDRNGPSHSGNSNTRANPTN